jgi:vacuolar-type H+-ATPase subunit F/Vma7
MRCVLLADRVTGIAYHLAGVEVIQPGSVELPAIFKDACDQYGLVLITAPLADTLPGDSLNRAIQRASPPVQVITPVFARHLPSKVTSLARRSLGVSQ